MPLHSELAAVLLRQYGRVSVSCPAALSGGSRVPAESVVQPGQ